MVYFDQSDIIHLVVSNDDEANSIEISPNITAEFQDPLLILWWECFTRGWAVTEDSSCTIGIRVVAGAVRWVSLTPPGPWSRFVT